MGELPVGRFLLPQRDEGGVGGEVMVWSQPLGPMALAGSVSWMTLHLEFDELARKR
jgi:hypothetical protein